MDNLGELAFIWMRVHFTTREDKIGYYPTRHPIQMVIYDLDIYSLLAWLPSRRKKNNDHRGVDAGDG